MKYKHSTPLGLKGLTSLRLCTYFTLDNRSCQRKTLRFVEYEIVNVYWSDDLLSPKQ